MKLSIIIPVYNVENYLVKCLNSCVFQNVNKSEYEIIVINDGSKDNCAQIIEQYDWKDCNHTIITQRNQGLSMARNNGVKVAKGDYVWFVDSDDWISESSLQILLPLLDGGTDIICQRAYFKNFEDKEVVAEKFGSYENGAEMLQNNYDVMAVLYIYRRDFFNNLGFAFEPNIYHEDTQFTPRAVYLSRKIKCISTPIYHYLQRSGSIMSLHNPKKVYDQIRILNELYAFCDKTVSQENRKGWIGHLMSGLILNLLWLAKQIDDKKVKRDVKAFLNSDLRYTKALMYSPIMSIKSLGFLSLLCLGNLYFAYSFVYNIRYNHKA